MSGELPKNYVPWAPPGIVVAVQYYKGDEARALRLARLLAEIQKGWNSRAIMVLVRRLDVPVSRDALETVIRANRAFMTLLYRSERDGDGHPNGANALWSGTMDVLADAWKSGDLPFSSVFTVEADGCPLSRDWLERITDEHNRAQEFGYAVTGPFMRYPTPHVNGSLVCSLPFWLDTPSMHNTPDGRAWDVHHAAQLARACYRTPLIKNIYGAKNWTNDQLNPLSAETAWLASTKDDSAIRWAESELVDRPAQAIFGAASRELSE